MSSEITAEYHHELAIKHYKEGRIAESIKEFEEAIFLKPKYAAAYSNRANALQHVGNSFDAILNYQKAIEIEPDVADYHNNLGAALMDRGRMEEAQECYYKALELKPKLAVALLNLGNVERAKGNTSPAADFYREAIEADPENNMAELALSLALLELGQYKEGWERYESRWKSGQLPKRGLKFPDWEGGRLLPGSAILIYSEQGFGDALQFCRYAAKVKEASGAKVYFEVRQPLVRLLKSLEGVDDVIPYGEKLPKDITHTIAVMSIPRVLGTTVETIPNAVPYLSVSNERIQSWEEELRLLPHGIKVGICWAGMSRPSQPTAQLIDERRSMRLEQFAEAAKVKGVSWVSLQLGPPLEQIKSPPPGMTILDVSENLDDFYDTASLIKNLDLVITVDTAVCHVAGALGVPTWMLSRFDGCWRWLGNRKDSPWYPTLRQFRQPKAGDWQSVVKEVAAELAVFVKERDKSLPVVLPTEFGLEQINKDGLDGKFYHPGELETIVAVLRKVKPKAMLEIGINEGRFAKAILQNVSGIEKYIGIDVLPGYETQCSIQKDELSERPGTLVKDNEAFELYLSKNGSFDWSKETLPRFDAVFIDGDHGARAVGYDSALAKDVINPGGVILWHDYHKHGCVDVKPVLDKLRSEGRDIKHIEGTSLAVEFIEPKCPS